MASWRAEVCKIISLTFCLRLPAIIFSFLPLVILVSVTAGQESVSQAFRFLTVADGIALGLTVLTEIVVMMDKRASGGAMDTLFPAFLLELVRTGLMLSACSVAIQQIYMFNHGEEHTRRWWMDVCKTPDLCYNITVAVALSCTHCVASFILTVSSAYLLTIPVADVLPAPNLESGDDSCWQ